MSESLRATIDLLVEAWNKNDMSTFASLFANDASYVSGAGLWFKGREAIVKGLSNDEASDSKNLKVVFRDQQIKLIKADVAVVHNTWEVSTDRDQGVQKPLRKGVITLVMVSDGNQWRIAALQNTDVTENVS